MIIITTFVGATYSDKQNIKKAFQKHLGEEKVGFFNFKLDQSHMRETTPTQKDINLNKTRTAIQQLKNMEIVVIDGYPYNEQHVPEYLEMLQEEGIKEHYCFGFELKFTPENTLIMPIVMDIKGHKVPFYYEDDNSPAEAAVKKMMTELGL